MIRAQVAAGDRADALRTYERARSMLIDELGVPPGTVLEGAYHEALMADAQDTGAAPLASKGLPTGTVTLLFTDFVGSTAIAGQLDAGDAEALCRSHIELLREVVAMRGGHEVKNLGDRLMAVFASTTDAVASAVAIRQAVDHNNQTAPLQLSVRVGVHVGEPALDHGDYFGIPVAVAKRLCDAADADQILASDTVRSLCTSDATFDDRRELILGGMSDPTIAWTVGWEPLPAPRTRARRADPFTTPPVLS